MSLRVRLALWYTLVLAVLLTIFAAGLYGTMSYTLSAEVDRELTARAHELAGRMRLWDPHRREPPPRPLPRVNVFSDDFFLQLVNEKGQVVARSANLEDAVLPVESASPQEAKVVTQVVNGTRIRLYNLPLWVDGRWLGSIQVARSLHQLDAALLRLRVTLVGGTLLTLTITAVAAGWLAGAFTHRINRITEAALRIGATHDLAERVTHRGPEDEIGRFAAAFNQMLDRLQAAYTQLNEAYQQQRRFLADVSHQLRTPLTVIRGNVELLRQPPERGNGALQEEALADIEAEAEHMSHLVGDLLTLARADAGKQTEKHPVLIGEVILEAVRKARMLAEPRQLAAEVPEKVANTAVRGHEGYLHQLFMILLDNAIKYTPATGAIRLSATVRDGRVQVAVADSGMGIPAQDQPRLFSRFFRGTNVRHIAGSGLGLAIAHWIVTDHGGTIQVSSQEGKGSTFTVQLPVLGEGSGA